MLRVKDIIISESAPNDPKVGWVTTANGKPTLRFNINGVWKDMIEKPDDPEEDIDSYYRILVDPAGSLWLLSIYGDADVSSTRYGNTDNSSVVIYPNQIVWCSAATEVLNVTVNTNGREKSGAMSGVSFLACKPEVTTINFTSGDSIVVCPTSPIQFTGSGNKLLQLSFIKTKEGTAYEVYVSVLGENF